MAPTIQTSKVLPHDAFLADWPVDRLVALASAKNLPNPNPFSKDGYATPLLAAIATDPTNADVAEQDGLFSFHVGNLPNPGALPRDFALEIENQVDHVEDHVDEEENNNESENEPTPTNASNKRKLEETEAESAEKRVPSGLSNETDEEKRMRSEFIDYLENNVGFTTDAMKARLANMSRRCAGDRKKFDFYDNALRAANDFAHMTPDAMRRSMVEYVGGRPPLAKDTMEFFARHLKHDKKMHPKAAALVIPKQITPRGKAGPTAVPKKRVQCHHCGKIGHLKKE